MPLAMSLGIQVLLCAPGTKKVAVTQRLVARGAVVRPVMLPLGGPVISLVLDVAGVVPAVPVLGERRRSAAAEGKSKCRREHGCQQTKTHA
ncbi:MAG: hypothetical protein AB7O13_03215 [Alphaproteobacteria bacterium]